METFISILAIVFPVAGTIIVALISHSHTRERKAIDLELKAAARDRAKSEARAELRARETLLSMRLMDANLDYSNAIAVCVTTGRVNGELTSARSKAGDAQDEYQAFLQEVTSGKIAKV